MGEVSRLGAVGGKRHPWAWLVLAVLLFSPKSYAQTSEGADKSAESTVKPAAPAGDEKGRGQPPCKQGDVPGCTLECDKGKLASCTVLGRMYVNGTGVWKDGARGAAVLQKACDEDAGEACRFLGLGYSDSKDAKRRQALLQKAIAIHQSGCNKGRASSCSALAFMVSSGWGVAKDVEKAASLTKKLLALDEATCKHADAWACYEAAQAYDGYHAGVAKDVAKKLALLRKSCHGDYAPACQLLGRLHSWGGKEWSQDHGKALAAFARAI